MTINQETITEFLQLGGQYALPIAALLRAIYAGIRGNLPEGFTQIAVASVFAGIAAVVDPSRPFDWRVALLELAGNTVFMAGLLSFIVLYLLRQPNRGLYFDGFVGGVLGLVAWVIWTRILLNDWPWWTAPFAIVGGAAGFIMLRFSLRQIAKLVRIATFFIILGVILVVGAGVVLGANWLITQLG
jgi:hypothetical protein